MFLTSRFRRAVASGDSGAVVIMVALLALVLFGAGALTVDLGEMYSRRRHAQTDADFAALAGVTALPNQVIARLRAYEYLEKNLPSGGAMPPITAFSDGDSANGEITFPTPYRVRVVVPRRTVEFGLAGAIGFDEATVSAAATAEVQSPAAALPFFATVGADSGYACVKDAPPGSNNGGGPPPNPSPVRAVLRQPGLPRPPIVTTTAPATLLTTGGETLTVNGDNFRNPAPAVTSVKIDGAEVSVWTIVNKNRITLVTPPHAAGPATLTVTNADGTASTVLTYVAPPPLPVPTVTGVSPNSGPSTGGTVVTITGTNLTGATLVTFGGRPATNVTVNSPTQVTATSPSGTGTVHVRVTTPGGISAETDADLFNYLIDPCEGVNGSFGYLDVPRSEPPVPTGANAPNALVTINVAAGVDHGWTVYSSPPVSPPQPPNLPPPNTPCSSGSSTIPHAVLDEPPGVEGANCIRILSGQRIVAAGEGFLDGYDGPGGDVGPRLAAKDGHDSGTLHGRTGMDLDRFSDYLNVSVATFMAALVADTATAAMLKPEIANCPRFAIVPVLNVAENPSPGYYPVSGFAGVFIDGDPPNHGLVPTNGGTQIESIRAYVFPLELVESIVPSGTTAGTVPYLGTGPKVPVLVHDSGDPSY